VSGNVTVKARYDYLPFGEEIGSGQGSRSLVTGYVTTDRTRQKFTQTERDSESGLDYFGARYYSSAQGRFTSSDPNPVTKENFVNPQRWNLYIYVNNNPLTAVDPNGGDGEGKGGDKVISVFLQISATDRNSTTDPKTGGKLWEAGPDWRQAAKDTKNQGYQLEVFGGNDVTGASGPPKLANGESFDNALKNSEVVLYVGHGYGPTENTPFMPLAIEVGFDVYDFNGKQLASGGTAQKPDSNE
jgi:RHS repeat-associated protein